MDRFRTENNKRMDVENRFVQTIYGVDVSLINLTRAYWLSVTNQRWLGIRLDVLGILLTFIVSVLSVAARFSISPSLTGLTLSYMLSVQREFSCFPAHNVLILRRGLWMAGETDCRCAPNIHYVRMGSF